MQVKTNYMNLYSPIKIDSNMPAKHQHRNACKKKNNTRSTTYKLHNVTATKYHICS